MQIRYKIENKQGITLIALVVTIVVLLILATVSIQMLGGEDGIIRQAIESKDKTKRGEIEEEVKLAIEAARIEGLGKIDKDKLQEELGKIGWTGDDVSSGLPAKGTINGVEIKIDENGNVTITEGTGTGGGETSIAGKKYEDETDITVDGTPVTVPGKFTVSGLEEESTIENGLVIYLVPDGTTVNWNDPTEVEYAQKNYDQFVWVPVPNAIAIDKNEDGTIDETDIDLMIADEEYPMAIATDSTNYRGILYDFTLTDGKVVVSDRSYSATSGYREPAYLTNSSYADASSYNTVGITESSLQTEFNTMVSKVASKKGFWVGRYETSNMVGTASTSSSDALNKATVAADSTNRITVIKGTTTGISYDSSIPNFINWYRMYAQQKNYSKLALGNTTTVTSSMIWGSQWDQIMIWMKNVDNTSQSSKYVVNSVGMGNFGTISGVDDGYSDTSNPSATGCFKVKNVYDLAGNVWDWTLEAGYTVIRVLRGGGYNDTNSSTSRSDDRNNYYPYNSYSSFGSRSTLY